MFKWNPFTHRLDYVGSGGGGGGGITTIFGDSGSVEGSSVTFTGVDSGATVRFVGDDVTTMSLEVTDENGNTIIGSYTTLPATGIQNTIVGSIAGNSLVNATGNVFVGFAAGGSLQDGSGNTVVGGGAGNNLLGNANTLVGYQSGTNYTGMESANICIFNTGTTGDVGIIRIGDPFEQTESHIIGPIYNSSAGTTDNCAYTLEGDPDTGVRFPAANQVALTAGGNDNVVVKQFSNDMNKLTNFFAGFCWNFVAPPSFPYNVLDANDCVVYVDTSAATTVNLPNTASQGRVFIIKDITGTAQANPITITTPGGTVTINLSTSVQIDEDFGSLIIHSDGANYWTL